MGTGGSDSDKDRQDLKSEHTMALDHIERTITKIRNLITFLCGASGTLLGRCWTGKADQRGLVASELMSEKGFGNFLVVARSC